jgi:hypothetical protein
MGDAGDSQRSRWAADATRNAPSLQTERTEGNHHTAGQDTAKWHALIDTIQNAIYDLKEEDSVAVGRARAALTLADTQVRALWTRAIRGPEAYDSRFNRIENAQMRIESTLDKLVKKSAGPAKTWAHVAAGPPESRRPIAADTPNRVAVRIRMEGSQEKTPGEILNAAKEYITDAFAVRQLRSGDVDVMVPDQDAKDRALSQPDVHNIKILRQSYLIEVPGVPHSLGVAGGKSADNAEVIRKICTESKKVTLGLVIDYVKWLHVLEVQRARVGPLKTRGSLIFTLPSKAMQLQTV